MYLQMTSNSKATFLKLYHNQLIYNYFMICARIHNLCRPAPLFASTSGAYLKSCKHPYILVLPILNLFVYFLSFILSFSSLFPSNASNMLICSWSHNLPLSICCFTHAHSKKVFTLLFPPSPPPPLVSHSAFYCTHFSRSLLF